jgi:G3E family GTPase
VIVNEFGEIGIDNDLVVGADEEVFEMNNGCVCCTVRGDLIRVLSGLMKRKGGLRRHHRGDHRPRRSRPVAQTFFVDEDVKAKTRLDSVTAVVDASHVLMRLADSREAVEQIAFADQIVLNKTDTVDEAQLQRVEAGHPPPEPLAPSTGRALGRAAGPLPSGRGDFDLERMAELCAREPAGEAGHVHDGTAATTR